MTSSIPAIEEMVDLWRDFVSEVEDGYGLTIYDYLNDLAMRSELAALLRGLPSSAKEHNDVAELDARFEHATREVVMRWPTSRSVRVPLHPRDELLKDFRDEGWI